MAIPHLYPQKFPRAVLFDWDNTLVDTWLICFEALNQTLIAYGHKPYTAEEFNQRPHASFKDSFPSIFEGKAYEAEQIFYQYVRSTPPEAIRPLPGAEKLLRYLFKKNAYVGIVSNKVGEILRQEVSYLGWEKYFSKVVGSRDTEADKPSPAPVFEALKGSAIKASHDVWFVGDSSIDILCAHQSGCVPVSVGPYAAPLTDPIVHGKDCLKIAKILTDL